MAPFQLAERQLHLLDLRNVGAKSFPAHCRDQDKSVQTTRGEGKIVTFKHHFNDFTRTEIPAQ